MLKERGIQIITFKGKNIPIKELLVALRKKEIISIFVEGGGKILGSFVDEKLVDKVYAFYAPIIIGGKKAITIQGKGTNKIKNALYLKKIAIKRFQDNFLVVGYSN